MAATRVPARSRIGAERDMRPSSSSSTISAQPRRLTTTELRGEPGERRHRSGCKPNRLGFLEPRFELALAQLGEDELPGGRGVQRDVGPDPADDAEAVCSIELGDDLHRGAARDDGKKGRLVGAVAEPAQRPVRSLDQRAVGIGAAREPEQLVADHPPGRSLGDEPSVGERPERAADRRSWLPGRARERRRRGRLGRLGHRGEDVDRPVERNGSGDASTAAHQMSSLDNQMIRCHHRRMLIDCDIHIGYETIADLIPYLDAPTAELVRQSGTNGLAMPTYPWNHPAGWIRRDLYERGEGHDANFVYMSLDTLRSPSPRPVRRRHRDRRARRGRRVLGAPERAARGPALQRLQRLAVGELAGCPSLGSEG